jgi:hypothetical protein
MTGLGYNSWASFAEETVYGTQVGTDEQYVSIIDEGLGNETSVDPRVSLRGASHRSMIQGPQKIAGDVSIEMLYEGLLLPIKHAMGGYAFTADTPVADANQHVFTLDDALPVGLSVEISKGDIPAGDVFLYLGGKVDALDFQFATAETMKLIVSLVAQSETPDGAASGTPTYPADYPVLWREFNSTMTFCGETISEFIGGNIKLENNLSRDRFLMHNTLRSPLRTDRRNVTGSVKMEFEDLALYNKYIAGTTGVMSLTFNTGYYVTGTTPYSIMFTLPKVQMLPTPTPKVSSPGPIEMDVPFVAMHDGSTTDALTVTIISGEATL